MKIVRLMTDDFAPRPDEMDCQWKVYSFKRHHKHSVDKEKLLPPTIGLRRKLQVGLAFLLRYSEHGLCSWTTAGDQQDFDHADGLLLWEYDPKEIGNKTYADREKDADTFLETFTCWCNGECYGYRVQEEVTLPCGHTEVRDIPDASGFGYYGNDMDYMTSEVAHYVQGDECRFEGDAEYLKNYHDFIGKKPEMPEKLTAPAAEACCHE
jgi:hypothetical protein